jgi:hypothetical protein
MLTFLIKVQHKYLWTLLCHSTDSINTSTLYFLCVFRLATSIVIWLLYVNIARLSNTSQSFNMAKLLYHFKTTYHGLCCEVQKDVLSSYVCHSASALQQRKHKSTLHHRHHLFIVSVAFISTGFVNSISDSTIVVHTSQHNPW